MISSGDSLLDIAEKLKAKGCNRVFAFTTFGLFVEGYDKFDQFYKDGLIDKIFTTNLVYGDEELMKREWYQRVDMSKYVAYLIDTINYDNSISSLLNPIDRIKNVVEKYNNK